MKYLESYNSLITEKLKINSYQLSLKKTLKELNITFFFVSTFGTAITAFFPIFESMVKNEKINSLSQTDIILLGICALAILFKENKQQIIKIKNILKEKGLIELLNKILKFMSNLKKLFTAISKNVGKLIISIVDLFSYTALFVPFLLGFYDLIQLYNINFENFDNLISTPSGLLMTSGLGIITITLKHFISILIKKVGRLSKKKVIKENLNTEIIYEYLLNS